MAHVVRRHLDVEAREQVLDRLPEREHAGAVGLQRGDDDVIHEQGLVAADKALARLRQRCLRLRLAQPPLLLGEPRLDVANSLEILVELVGIGGIEPPLHALRIFEHRVEHAPFLGQQLLPLLERCVLGGKKPVERDHGAVEPGHRLTAMIPRERQAGTVARTFHAGLTGVELDGCKPRVPAELCGRNLIHGNRVVKALTGCAEGVGARQPKCAAPVRVVGKPVRAALDDREVVLVARQRREALWQRVAGPNVARLWKPRFLGHAVADPEAHHPLGRGRRGRGPGEPPESERLERREGQQRAGGFQEPAAGGCGEHGYGLRKTVTSCETRGSGRPHR